MDIDDEVVETSDIEELEEELQDRARKARKSLDNDEHEHSTERGICRPPRKRAKVGMSPPSSKLYSLFLLLQVLPRNREFAYSRLEKPFNLSH